MKNSIKIQPQNEVQNTPVAPINLNTALSHFDLPKGLYFIPTYKGFAYTPILSQLAVKFDLYSVFEIIFTFKLAFQANKRFSEPVTRLDIKLTRSFQSTYSITYYHAGILIFTQDLGQRKFDFHTANFTLVDNMANVKHLLVLPEELADPNHFINA